MTEAEIKEADKWLVGKGQFICADGVEQFKHKNDLNNMGSMCMIYTFKP